MLVFSDQLYTSFAELKHNPPNADLYIVGSDQVWNFPDNFEYYKSYMQAYLLGFNDTVPKISYAASFARENIGDNLAAYIATFLQSFSAISVRESTGIALCEKCGYNKAVHVVDPTLLHDSMFYQNRFNLSITDTNFVFAYFLEKDIEISLHQIFSSIKSLGYSIIYSASQGRFDLFNKIYPSISDWLKHIACSSIVFTNSFHCVVFSIIFQKKFVYFPLIGNYVEANNRIFDMLRTLDLLSNVFNGDLKKQLGILKAPTLANYNLIQQSKCYISNSIDWLS